MNRVARIALSFAAILLIALGAAWLLFFYPVKKAEQTIIPDYELKLQLTSRKIIIPYIDVDCSKQKYTSGWRKKLQASRSLNYWAAKALNAEEAFVRYEREDKYKLSGVAAADTIRYWTTATYLKKELECYDIATLKESKPY